MPTPIAQLFYEPITMDIFQHYFDRANDNKYSHREFLPLSRTAIAGKGIYVFRIHSFKQMRELPSNTTTYALLVTTELNSKSTGRFIPTNSFLRFFTSLEDVGNDLSEQVKLYQNV